MTINLCLIIVQIMIHIFHTYWITKSNIGVSALKKMFDSGQSKLQGNLEKSKSITSLYKNDKSCNYERDDLSTHKTGNMLIHEKFIMPKAILNLLLVRS